MLPLHLFRERHYSLYSTQIHYNISLIASLDNTGDYFAFSVTEFFVDYSPLCLTDFLNNNLFSSLSSDSPKLTGSNLYLKDVTYLILRIDFLSFIQGYLKSRVRRLFHNGFIRKHRYLSGFRMNLHFYILGSPVILLKC